MKKLISTPVTALIFLTCVSCATFSKMSEKETAEIHDTLASLCAPEKPWTAPQWDALTVHMVNESTATAVFEQIKTCSTEPSSGQLMATLEFLKWTHLKPMPTLQESTLAWLKNRWAKTPDHIDNAIIEMSGVMDALLQIQPTPMPTLYSLGILSTEWVRTEKQVQALSTEALKPWSKSLSRFLPQMGQAEIFRDRFLNLSSRLKASKDLNWAIIITRRLCSTQACSDAECLKRLNKLHAETSTQPELRLKVDMTLLARKMGLSMHFKHPLTAKEMKKFADQVDSLAAVAKKVSPTDESGIYDTAIDFFLEANNLPQAEMYLNKYSQTLDRKNLMAWQTSAQEAMYQIKLLRKKKLVTDAVKLADELAPKLQPENMTIYSNAFFWFSVERLAVIQESGDQKKADALADQLRIFIKGLSAGQQKLNLTYISDAQGLPRTKM